MTPDRPGAVVYLPDEEFDTAQRPSAGMVAVSWIAGGVLFAMTMWLILVVFWIVFG
jgi:hypothetical protein